MNETKTVNYVIDDSLLGHNVLTKQNQEILNKLYEEAQQEIKPIFEEEEQRWIDEYVKVNKLEDID
jgi:hypothetical protein